MRELGEMRGLGVSKTISKKSPPKDFSLGGLNLFVSLKKGGYLLSRIALQYHRRKQA